MKRREFLYLFRKALIIFCGSSLASILTMLTIQLLMGGIRDIQQVISRSLLIGLGMGLVVFLAPKKKTRYPWL